VPTIGCRRAGGGLVGVPAESNVAAGAALAAAREPDVVVFDGSGAAIPPVAVDARVLVTRGPAIREGLNGYRVLVSDLVVFISGGDAEAVRAIKDVPVVEAELRLVPTGPLEGRRVAVFTSGPARTDHLDAEVVHVSRALADRATLHDELELERVRDADVYLVELKAAAIDVVAETALERGVELVLADNEVVAPELDEQLLSLLAVPA
jgi:cyclic 2,3-diphosphoglycerate synthetase